MTVRRTVDHGGTTGALEPRGAWSAEVVGLAGDDAAGWLAAAGATAAADGRLDLRSRAPLPGAHEVVPGEHAVPVPVPLADVEATRALGRQLAGALRAGDLVVLSGPLGAGKTTLVQGLGEGLGVRGRVTSPTFVLARVHRGPLPLVHVDAYRLREAGAGRLDLEDLDLDAALEQAVAVVEWGEGVVEHLAASRLEIALERRLGDVARTGDDGRAALVRAVGPRWAVLGG